MPLIGGGGAGNTAGSNPSGTGSSLNYIGNHAYAESGAFSAKNTIQTLFDFTTSGDYIVATLILTAPIRMTSANITAGGTRGYQLNFNSQTVGLYKVDSGGNDMPAEAEISILIPPFTAVVLTCIDNSTDANTLGTATLTGRVYA